MADGMDERRDWAAACLGKPFFAVATDDLANLGILPLGLFAHGSRLLGTERADSDWDFEVVVGDGTWEGAEQVEIGEAGSGHQRQFTLIALSDWIGEAEACTVRFCECAFLPEELTAIRLVPAGWRPDAEKVRRQFSRTASNSWVKAKKKLIVADSWNPLVAKKSLWHSLRILMFGIQILEHGSIVDFHAGNDLFWEILSMPDDWGMLDERFRPIRNELRSRFRSHDGELGIVRHS